MTHKERAIAALNNRTPDYVPTFELAFQLTQEAFGREFYAGTSYDALPERDREELCRQNARLYLEIARKYEHSIIPVTVAPSSIYPQRALEIVSTMRFIREEAMLDGEEYLLITHGDATFAIPEGEELEEMIELLADDPEKLHQKAEMLIYHRLGYNLFYAQNGADGFMLCDDYAFNSNPFFSPEQFARFVSPYLARIISTYRSMGKFVIKHSDGNLMPILDEIVRCRPHAIHSIDPQGNMDIAWVKQHYGREVALCGNVNCGLLQTGSEEEVFQSCEYAFRHGKPGGGFIFCTSNCAFKGMPLERYEWINQYWKKHRDYR